VVSIKRPLTDNYIEMATWKDGHISVSVGHS
jgi:hypothetical protein